MNLFYKNKNVWITGASSGIGKAMSIMLAKMGANIILSSENENELNQTLEACIKYNNNCTSWLLDQSKQDDVDNITNQIIEKHKKIDVLILNAGISQRANSTETSLNIHDTIMQINFRSNVQISNIIIPKMIENGGGHIGVTSSISGKFGFFLRSSYSASKHGLHGYFESVGLENKKNNIHISVVCPGRVKTNISYNAIVSSGEKHKQLDDGQAKGISSEKCAKKYLKAIKNRKKEKLIGKEELIMVYIKNYFPSLFYYLANRINKT